MTWAFAADFAELSDIGRDPEGGWKRLAFSEAENAAHQWFLAKGRALGLSVRQDGFGNSILRLEGQGKTIALGSHLDTVSKGGAYDGAAGVLAALSILTRAKAEGWQGPPLEAIAFRDEEGRFGPFMGSRAMAGLHDVAKLLQARAADGAELAPLMRAAGFSPDNAPYDFTQMQGFLELHIEQGPVLEETQTQIGIVTAIAGQERLALRFGGRADHAGTAPMDRRKDAFAAAARFAVAFRAAILSASETDLRGTIGIVNILPNQGNVVPSEVKMGLEIRGSDGAQIVEMRARVEALAEEIAREEGLELKLRRVYSDRPVPMCEEWQANLHAAARDLGLKAQPILSGANHDSGILGRIVPTAMVFVPSLAGRSHCPEEFSALEDLEAALDLIFDVLKKRAIAVS